MAEKRTTICDHCGTEIDRDEDINGPQLKVKAEDVYQTYRIDYVLCLSCRKELKVWLKYGGSR